MFSQENHNLSRDPKPICTHMILLYIRFDSQEAAAADIYSQLFSNIDTNYFSQNLQQED
jgi:hypothetical protein